MEKRIKEYLDQRAKEDPLFAVTYAKENKSIKGCCAYITSQAKKKQTGGCAMIEDSTVFGWAVHYYDEDDIKDEKVSKSKATAITSETTPPKDEIKKEAPKAKLKPNKKEDVGQLSLF